MSRPARRLARREPPDDQSTFPWAIRLTDMGAAGRAPLTVPMWPGPRRAGGKMNRLVVVSNRVPLPSASNHAGGLAVALDGLMEKRGGLWFGWSGAIAPASGTNVCLEHADGIDYATIDL